MILYTHITPEAMRILTRKVAESGVSRPVYVDALIKDHDDEETLKLERPVFKPNLKRIKRRSPGLIGGCS
jgi:hypothetical protein